MFKLKTISNHAKYLSRFMHNSLVAVKNQSEENGVTIRPEIIKDSSMIEKCEEDLSHVAPFLKPTFNFAAYVNKSETLKQFVNLGVNLHHIEKKHNELVSFILSLDFEKDVKPYIWFFSDLGVEDIGGLISKNPEILKEHLDDLQVRLNYLSFKKFDRGMITRIVEKNPHWLSHSVQDIDSKLGFFQNSFDLTGNEVRSLAVKKPKLITYNMRSIKINRFVVKEEMGFDDEEIKKILFKKPEIFLSHNQKILNSFVYVHQVMKIPLERIVDFPQVLTCREFRIRQRHLFLEKLDRAQYDPMKPNYISLLDLISKDDGYFASEIAKSSIQIFNVFLKSL